MVDVITRYAKIAKSLLIRAHLVQQEGSCTIKAVYQCVQMDFMHSMGNASSAPHLVQCVLHRPQCVFHVLIIFSSISGQIILSAYQRAQTQTILELIISVDSAHQTA